MADPDGDSQMHSSPSSSTSDSEMFPAPAEPTTPRAQAGMRGGDLSPPASQPRSGGGDPDMMDTGSGALEGQDEPIGVVVATSRKAEEEPGWAWKNPKAREEAERSLELALDRDFSMSEFGELFDLSTVPGATQAAR